MNALLLAAALIASPVEVAPEDRVFSFVNALLAGYPTEQLPFASSKVGASISGVPSSRPDIEPSLNSFQRALKVCKPVNLINLGETPDKIRIYEAWFKCPDDGVDESKKLRLSVYLKDGRIGSTSLLIGNMGAPSAPPRHP